MGDQTELPSPQEKRPSKSPAVLGLKKITSDLKEELLLTPWYGLATDGSSDEDDRHFPLSVRHVDKDSGLIVTSLLDITKY